eukprot:s459_g21.t1
MIAGSLDRWITMQCLHLAAGIRPLAACQVGPNSVEKSGIPGLESKIAMENDTFLDDFIVKHDFPQLLPLCPSLEALHVSRGAIRNPAVHRSACSVGGIRAQLTPTFATPPVSGRLLEFWGTQ